MYFFWTSLTCVAGVLTKRWAKENLYNYINIILNFLLWCSKHFPINRVLRLELKITPETEVFSLYIIERILVSILSILWVLLYGASSSHSLYPVFQLEVLSFEVRDVIFFSNDIISSISLCWNIGWNFLSNLELFHVGVTIHELLFTSYYSWVTIHELLFTSTIHEAWWFFVKFLYFSVGVTIHV